MTMLETPLTWAYRWAAESKNFLYDVGFADSLKLPVPVISIGNLTVGGTGKTPISQMIISHFHSKGIRPALVSRSYKAQLRGTAQVDTKRPFAAQFYGDEPTLLAMNNPTVPVFVGPSKWAAAQEAVAVTHPQVIVVDDGFQHRALHRDLDLVMVDVTVPLSDYDWLPRGRAREGFSSLQRADFIFLTKVNLVDEMTVELIRAVLPDDVPVMEVAYRLETKVEEAGIKALAFSGLARPESFKTSIQQDTLYELADFITFPDHYVYTENDIKNLLEKMVSLEATVLLTTEKDWVKVKNLVSDEGLFRVLSLQTHFLGGSERQQEFYAALDQVVR